MTLHHLAGPVLTIGGKAISIDLAADDTTVVLNLKCKTILELFQGV